MRFLLDVNSLIALGFADHALHSRMVAWMKADEDAEMLSCPIVDLGFARMLSQAASYAFSVEQARSLLQQSKASPVRPLRFHADDRDISQLPRWVKSAGQTTQGHLIDLAKAHGCKVATFDVRIPTAFLIP
jgi:hypothetical protein